MENTLNIVYKIISENNLYGLNSIIYSVLWFILRYHNVCLNMPMSSMECVHSSLQQNYNLFKIESLFLYNLVLDLNIRFNKLHLINDIFKYHLANDNLSYIKEYLKYYNHQKLVEWLVQLADPKITQDSIETILDGNVKINSFLDEIVQMGNDKKINWTIHSNKIVGVQSDEIINDLVRLNLLFRSEQLNRNIINDNLLINDIKWSNQTFDLIFFDLPAGLHNIIHATCCQKVKKLKLRGTKAEPLLLQYIMMSLNKNGRAIVIVPDSLLFSDSVQHIETRKYLIENFNVKKIIQIDESFYKIKGNKFSVIYFENNGKTKQISFSKLLLNNENITEENITTIQINLIKNNLYSLYYKLYLEISKQNNKIQYEKVKNLFNIYTDSSEITDQTTNILAIDKYYKNNSSVQILNDMSHKEYSYYFTEIKDSNGFFIRYLEYFIKNRYEKLVKGKMNQYDISKIENIEIPVLSKDKQFAISSYIELTNKIIQDNLDKIVTINRVKSCVFDTVPLDEFIQIDQVCEIYIDTTVFENKLIGIIKNGLTAGSVYLLENKHPLLNNSHYLNIKDANYNIEFIYQYLKYREPKLQELARLTSQPTISKSTISSFCIPVIDLDKQMQLLSYCKDFDNTITMYEEDIKNIQNKDIIGTVIKMNNMA